MHIENSEVFSACYQKVLGGLKGGQKLHLFQQHDFPFNVFKIKANTYSKEPRLLMNHDRGKLFLIILKICQ